VDFGMDSAVVEIPGGLLVVFEGDSGGDSF
jgi:hypothetical protein